MCNRISGFAKSLSVVAVIALVPSNSGAVHFPLGPSKNDWGLKYDVQVSAAGADKVNVVFTLTDEGRLKPIHSVTVVALRSVGGGSFAYDVKTTIPLQSTPDGKRSGQVQIPKKYADQALFRILTLTVDGRRQTAGAALYDIPLKKFLNQVATATSTQAPTTSLRRQ